MGWSCALEAGNTMNYLREKLRGPLNLVFSWESRGEVYFLDPSSKEHQDGAITGKVLRVKNETLFFNGSLTAEPVNSFRIEPDGTLSRGPATVKKLLALR